MPKLREVKANEPIMQYRKCGHYAGYTFDLTLLRKDGTGEIISYCAMCMVEKLGLKPVAEHHIIRDKQHPEGKLVKIWEEK